tara:strand:+ start:3708 stop:4517 length:810 start_codon:yes stop_codon:yes gene_type:complete
MLLYKLKKLIVAILPPAIFNLGQIFLYKLKGKDIRKSINEEPVVRVPLERDATFGDFNKIYNIPVDKLFHYGGQSFNSAEQPFYNYLHYGEDSFKQYYKNYQPSNCLEAHKVNIDNNYSKLQNSNFTLPWHNESAVKYEGEFGLSHHHGHSAFGPLSKQKLKLEIFRIKTCLQSLEKHGYIQWQLFPKIDSDLPRCYMLKKISGECSFHVVSGKHRVACMAYLGWKNIPIKFDISLSRIVLEEDCAKWPGVINGCYNKKQAIDIFNTYF